MSVWSSFEAYPEGKEAHLTANNSILGILEAGRVTSLGALDGSVGQRGRLKVGHVERKREEVVWEK
jgi:hypothetical protein